MDTIFENTYVDSYECISELNRKVYDPKRPFLGWFYIACAIIIAIVIRRGITWYYIAIGVAMVAYGIYNLFYHKIWAKWLMRKILRENKGAIPPGIVTVTDCFNLQYKSTVIQFPIADLKKAYFLKHTIRIVSNDDAFMTFQRTGFQKGSAEELEVFIREKCPQAQIIHKL